jgi:hypothetical protein
VHKAEPENSSKCGKCLVKKGSAVDRIQDERKPEPICPHASAKSTVSVRSLFAKLDRLKVVPIAPDVPRTLGELTLSTYSFANASKPALGERRDFENEPPAE